MKNKNILLIPLILIWLSGCASVEKKNIEDYKPYQKENIDKQKKAIKEYIKTDPTNPEKTIPSYKARKDKEKVENHYVQETSGKYIITNMDKSLTVSYSRRHVLRFQELKKPKTISWNEDLRGPYGRWNHVYEKLKIDRGGISPSGKTWKVYIQEDDAGEFTINGTNSLDIKIDKKCKTLLECFKML